MKIKNSFLFFCLYIICFICDLNQKLHAQKAVDSSNYYYNLVVNPKQSTDLTLAFTFYEKRKNRHVLKQDTLGVISDLRFMASIQKKLGFLYDSESTSIEALELLNHINVDKDVLKSKIGVYNHLGIIQREYNNYDEALKFYNKSLALATKTSDSITIINNIANIYLDQKKYDQAISALKNSYNSSIALNNKKQIARALNNLGAAQSKINTQEALSNITKALNIREGINDNIGMYSSYKHLAEYYQERNKTALALNYANKAYKVAKSINSANYINDALSHIIDLDKNPKVVEYKKLSDSFALSRRLGENKFASVKYQSSENIRKAQESELKLKTSELNKQAEERLKLLYMSIAGFIIILSSATYFILKSRHRKDKLLQVYNTETRISKKLHDEVANDIYHVMTKLQSNNNKVTEVLDDLEGIYSKTRDISKESSTIELNENFENHLDDLLHDFHNNAVSVITKGLKQLNWEAVTDLKKTAIYRVLQELMTNMQKHSKASIVVLKFENSKDKIIINYSDNGVGCDIKKQNGLQNAENRIISLNGTIIFDSQVNKGFNVKITL
ncbi:MAG: tetratricopeptide repeat protein [Algibacter sp.]|uniref:tetratricopeptide repeat-containing sensor histidine kinase n=1 Tax=Algibacter sp. TaxID=1872428 RepID=UPI00260F4B77|nr:tetratricopeptide repeat-containing sensor histidine kinase [Algibacter sp.]MDG1729053.1 tetratricopeptide repeat protein [Algibacter sp.]